MLSMLEYFSETHLDNYVTDEQINIEGLCQIIRKNRDYYGGGIAILPKHGVAVIRTVFGWR